jgi:hypothetical protein
MNTSNWPQGTDYSSTNWTGRVPRTAEWGGNWAPNSHRIPPVAWIGAAIVVAAWIGVLWLAVFAGF